VQRRVLYLGEVNDSQQAAWRKTLEVFDERQQRMATLSLFPEDRPVPADARPVDPDDRDGHRAERLRLGAHRRVYGMFARQDLLGKVC